VPNRCEDNLFFSGVTWREDFSDGFNCRIYAPTSTPYLARQCGGHTLNRSGNDYLPVSSETSPPKQAEELNEFPNHSRSITMKRGLREKEGPRRHKMLSAIFAVGPTQV
jgi:hypothetical protein